MNEDNSYLVRVPVDLNETLKSFGKYFLLITSCTRSLLSGTEINDLLWINPSQLAPIEV